MAPAKGLRVSEQSVLQQGLLSFVLIRTQLDGARGVVNPAGHGEGLWRWGGLGSAWPRSAGTPW